MITTRRARHGDISAIETLMAPEIARGQLLPRAVTADEFLVAEFEGKVVGTVALTHQSEGVVELGSLVAKQRGVGLGHALVSAAITEAQHRGYRLVMALTSIAPFFTRMGFSSSSYAPWMAARKALSMPYPLSLRPSPEAVEAADAKAATCRGCSRLMRCTQDLLVFDIPRARRQRL